jgi:hypothetical protein
MLKKLLKKFSIGSKARTLEMEKPYLLLNISRQYENGMTRKQLYERTRKYWKLNPNSYKQVKRAVAVADNIIRAIYCIDDWIPVDMEVIEAESKDADRRYGDDIDRPSKSRHRWEFIGKEDREAWGKFVGQPIPQELRKRQNPISWVI